MRDINWGDFVWFMRIFVEFFVECLTGVLLVFGITDVYNHNSV